MTTELPYLKEVISRFQLDARKSLGQHFLLDPGITRHIVSLAGSLKGRTIIEVGPGPGGLTRALLHSDAQNIYAVELDTRAIEATEYLATFFPERLHVMHANALKMELNTLGAAPRQIIANLPYNVGTALLIQWLRQAKSWEQFLLMFQEEVALRICALPSSEHYGRLSVLAQWVAECHIQMRIAPGAFSPPPKVYSAVIRIIPHSEQPDPALFKAMETVTAAAFGQRRKMLRRSLAHIGGPHLLARAGIDESRRAETLTIAEFDSLAKLHLATHT